ncbi:MAG: hypothetical protein D6737_05980 [Chloroflexi bacterium]|nr:MAG: hypothetical protein D6737_05980 [Chloroflexota bacterium]
MGRVLLLATEDVIGTSGLMALLRTAALHRYQNTLPSNNLDKQFPFEDVSALSLAVDRVYGPRGGRNTALRIGEAAFKRALFEFGPVMGIDDMIVRLLPWSVKLDRWGEILSGMYNGFSDQIIRLESDSDAVYWHVERCPFCWGRQMLEPRCFIFVGLLQESLRWLSGERTYPVEQTTCTAMGDACCTFVIGRTPLG